ncbi:YDG domain-containing protein [Allofournierella sp.]|uniref:YDG domain-containing protein n=1 Tax=Allofournierella sp. TaxID=1940256 RepID=UPI003AB75C32
MKRKQWLAGILAAGLLCAAPLLGASAAPRAGTRAAAPAATGAATMTLTAEGGTTNYTYGDTITLKATYTPAAGESVPTDAQAVFMCGTEELGQAKLEQNASASNYEATLAYTTTSKKGMAVGQNSITAQYTPSGGSSAVVSSPVSISMEAKALSAVPQGTVTYNGTATFKNVPLTLTGLESGDTVSAKADLTVNDKNVGTPQVTAAADPAALKSTAAGTAKSAASGAQKDTPPATISLSGGQAAFYTLPARAVKGSLTIAPAKLTFTAGAGDKPYDGGKTAAAKAVQFTGLQNGETLEKDTDYTVSAEFTGDDYNAADAPKDVRVILTLTNRGTAKNYELGKSTFDTNAKITPAPLTVESVTIQEKTYDGTTNATVTAVQFSGLVGGDSLTLGTDYTAAAEFFTDANAATGKEVQVTVGTGTKPLTNYTLPAGAFSTTGTIAKKALTESIVTNWNIGAYTYDGAEKQPVPTVSDGNLLGPSDYELAYANNVNAGTATVTVKALAGGNYTGEVAKTFDIQKAAPLLNITMERKSESGKAPVLRVTVTTVRASTSAAWPTGKVRVTVQAGSESREGTGVFQGGSLTLDLTDLPGASSATVSANYAGDTNYEPAAGSTSQTLTPAPTPAPTQKPAATPGPTPAPTPKPFDWYPALGSIQSVASGKVTIDAGSEIAVPHFIWQAIYGKDITLTITRGADKYVFNGLDLKASGFDPDNGHNLTDLKAYIGRSYDKPKATATPAPTASPKPTASPSPAPTASPAPTTAPQATPAPSAQPAQGGGASGWLYWVIGGAAVLIVILGAVLFVLRRKSAGQDPYGYND